MFTTMKSNVALLKTAGSLVDPEVLAKFPNTVKDAIDLVESLGERYPWVDSLCIVQDDDE